MTLNFDLSSATNIDHILKCIQIGCVPEVSTNENHIDTRYKDLQAHKFVAKSVLIKLNTLLSKLLNNFGDLQIKPEDILNSCLYLCGEHHRSNLPWSDIESHSMMNLCIEKICRLMHFSNIEDLLMHMDISKFIVGLQHKLENGKWKKYPAAVECFMWILKYLKMPHLNSLLYLVMPLPLNMFDDYEDSNIIIALDAFQHIIDNTPAAELAMSGYNIVLLKSFENCLSCSLMSIVPHLLPCFLSLISKMEMKHLSKTNSLEWTKFDDLMQMLLPQMALVTPNPTSAGYDLIEHYASIFPLVLKSVGFSCIRWSERLMGIFAVYIMHSTVATVKAIEVFIKQTWPRKCTHWNVLLTILIKALYSEHKTGIEPNKDNIFAISECIRTLEAVRPECVRNVLNKLKECKQFESKKMFLETLETL